MAISRRKRKESWVTLLAAAARPSTRPHGGEEAEEAEAEEDARVALELLIRGPETEDSHL